MNRMELAGWLCGIGTAIREGRADHMGDDYADALDEAATLLERISSSEVTEEMVMAGEVAQNKWLHDSDSVGSEVAAIYLAMRSAATSERKG